MKKVLFLANHFVTLYSFRKELIKKLIEDGNEVFLSLPESDENKYFNDMGCNIMPTEIDRRGINPIKDLKLILFYKQLVKNIKPDIIFSYTIKPNIYGTLASNGKFKQVCNITGTGATFLSTSLISFLCKILYKISIKKCYKVFFQNNGDLTYFQKNKMISDNYELIPGSGCNLDEHVYSEMPQDSTIRFIFVGRVMKLKGIEEYLECARIVKNKYPNTEFIIAGWNEEEKYKQIVSEYQQNGFVNYIGFCKNIKEWIKKCHCTILPSHGGEGVPNVLLESAALGRACIGSNINGTRDVICENENGYLFEVGNTDELIRKVEKFIMLSYEDKSDMGKRGREKVSREFDREIIIKKYCDEVKKA